jgi:hypothetical protein
VSANSGVSALGFASFPCGMAAIGSEHGSVSKAQRRLSPTASGCGSIDAFHHSISLRLPRRARRADPSGARLIRGRSTQKPVSNSHGERRHFRAAVVRDGFLRRHTMLFTGSGGVERGHLPTVQGRRGKKVPGRYHLPDVRTPTGFCGASPTSSIPAASSEGDSARAGAAGIATRCSRREP